MKKLFNRLMGTMLTVSLVAGGFPASVNATTMESGRNPGFVKKQTAESLKSTSDKGEVPYVEGEVIVVNVSKKKSINAFKKETSSLGVQVVDTYNFDGGSDSEQLQISLVKSDQYTTEELIEQFHTSGTVKMVQPNYKYYSANIDENLYNESLWGIDNQGQNAGTVDMDINSDSENIKPAQGEGEKEKVVAVIDTGVDYTQEELKDVIWNNPNTIRLKGEHGYDSSNGDTDPIDDNGHGTHCAGIIKSVLNDDNIKIMPLKFLDEVGEGDTYAAIGAYNYIYTAQQLGINVVAINNSWCGYGELMAEDYVLQSFINMVGENGAVSVCAAGNEAFDNDKVFVGPASFDSPYIISVAAANERGELADFSNYSANEVDIAAPGTSILSTVSYDCFNPSVYGKDENGNQKLCSTYQDFSGNLVTPDVPGTAQFETIPEDSVCYAFGEGAKSQSVSLTNEDYFGQKTEDAKALQWNITGATEDGEYYLYLPYHQESSDTPVYLNLMIKASSPQNATGEKTMIQFMIGDAKVKENGEVDIDNVEFFDQMLFGGYENYWNQASYLKAIKVEKPEERVLVLCVVTYSEGDYQVTLDDFAISKSNVSTEEFGKTAFYNGTSMATPYVAGAVASLANAYPKDSVEERIARVKGSVRKVESLADKVVTGGMLDLSKSNNPAPLVETVKAAENGNIEITGKFFKEAEIQINGKNVPIQSLTNEKVIVEGNYFNQILNLNIKMGDTTYSKEYFFVKGKEPEKVANITEVADGRSLVSDGNFLYYVASNGSVYAYLESLFEESNGGYAEMVYYVDMMDTMELFGDAINFAQINSQAVCMNSDLYAIAELDSQFTRKEILIKFNWETSKWEKVTNIPDKYSDLTNPEVFNGVTLSTLASYNGKLYVLGGIDTNTNEPSNSVYVYDVEKGKWSQETSMPEVRYASKALQVGNRLVVTLGGNGTDEFPANLIFDGKNWTVSKAKVSGYGEKKYYNYDMTTESSLSYVEGEIGLVKDGIIYTDYRADGLGDTFLYQVKEDKYVSSGYSIESISKNKEVHAATLGESFYVFTGPAEASYLETEVDGLENGATVYKFNVSDGRYFVNENMPEGGTVYGTGAYIPGETVEVGAEPVENYYLKSLKVNGENVSVTKTGGSTRISNIASDVSVEAEFGAYVTELQLEKTNISIIAGSKQKLKVQVIPQNAENQKLQFKSSNKKVITVDSKGNIKANKNAAGKSATITITAKDRNTVIATCKVTVRKPVKVKKLKLSTKKNVKKVKAGKTLNINTKITPANADNQELVWTSSNKKYATVKNGVVKGKKAGIGKKVTITAKTKDGSKVKASIQIKIVK